LSADDNFESHWMIFDINTQHWTFFMNDLSFVFDCCYGNMLTLRNVHYYFNNGVPGSDRSPIHRILDNGTSIDLGISESQFYEEYLAAVAISNLHPNGIDSLDIGFLSIVQAPFYQRFYEDVPT
jgi:hypothetical protein